jgi:hypothetical protein
VGFDPKLQKSLLESLVGKVGRLLWLTIIATKTKYTKPNKKHGFGTLII